MESFHALSDQGCRVFSVRTLAPESIGDPHLVSGDRLGLWFWLSWWRDSRSTGLSSRNDGCGHLRPAEGRQDGRRVGGMSGATSSAAWVTTMKTSVIQLWMGSNRTWGFLAGTQSRYRECLMLMRGISIGRGSRFFLFFRVGLGRPGADMVGDQLFREPNGCLLSPIDRPLCEVIWTLSVWWTSITGRCIGLL